MKQDVQDVQDEGDASGVVLKSRDDFLSFAMRFSVVRLHAPRERGNRLLAFGQVVGAITFLCVIRNRASTPQVGFKHASVVDFYIIGTRGPSYVTRNGRCLFLHSHFRPAMVLKSKIVLLTKMWKFGKIKLN